MRLFDFWNKIYFKVTLPAFIYLVKVIEKCLAPTKQLRGSPLSKVDRAFNRCTV